MKLNNHGWGYRDMIIYGCIILLFLLLAAYNINYLYDGLNTSNGNNTNTNVQQPVVEESTNDKPREVIVDYTYYQNAEMKIKNATLNYLNDYNYELSEQILNTSLDTLVNLGYMSKVYDQTGSYVCTGYSNSYLGEDGEYVIKAYVNCNNYITEGY